MAKKFKIRLFKLARELNVGIDTIEQQLKELGYARALSGRGANAVLEDEAAYEALLEAFAHDREMAARLKELREARGEAARAAKVEPEPPATEEVEEAEADGAYAETEAVTTTEEVVPEAVDEAVAVEVQEPAEASEAPAEATDEVVEEPETGEEVEVEEAAEETAEETTEVAESIEATGPEVQEDISETETPVVEAETITAPETEQAEEDEVIRAQRYQLQGAKVIGKIDLSKLEEDDARPGKRKRKRKRKAKPAPEAVAKVTVEEDEPEKPRAKRKRKRKRIRRVDEEEVEQSLQETLRELEQGVSRIRQRRRRERRERHAQEREREAQQEAQEARKLRVTEYISTGELAELMGVDVSEVISALFNAGMIVSINQRLDADTIQFVADEFGYEVEFITDYNELEIEIPEDRPEDLRPRAPIVTVMGHVDHGKTSLLDYIRNTNVVAGEAGGITQHIGAYHVELPDGRHLTFLDTPGHEAFTAMRARGAKVTDIVILVVAADDGVMPQTVEAINHAKAAGVPIVVAITKIDKPEANPQRVMQQLAENGVLVEQYGGQVQCALVSAKTGEGVDDLLEKVLLEAELHELKANPNRPAVGTIIESRVEKGRGNVATVLVQNGTLRVGDPFVAGVTSGRVRAMFDERGKRVREAGPSIPVLVLGFDELPEVGDQFVVMPDEKEARAIAQKRQQIRREQMLRKQRRISLDEISRRMAQGGSLKELNLIIKGDVAGSVEALTDALLKLSTDEVAVNIIHGGVGAITESDVMLASASDAIIIGFQVRPSSSARQLAEREHVDIRLYSVIYQAIEEVRDALEGLLSPEKTEQVVGVAEVRETFKIPKVGTVAGCRVVEGRIRRGDRVRVIRDGVVIYEGTISSLRRFKDDVREVQSGYECGVGIENFNDIKVGDQIEAFEIVEQRRKLEVR
ncbi:MAG: translation initiation factor IF-2 [Rhodothermus sp.]|nr:translation initiation factor IF-2 [Rhodothermus sp.]